MITSTKLPTPDRTQRSYTLDEWNHEGRRLFGSDKMLWRFVCPSCGHVQTPQDFLRLPEGATKVASSNFCCIGRYTGDAGEMCGGKRPCNYTTGGFLNISPVSVTMPGGVVARCFDFDRSPDSELATPQPRARKEGPPMVDSPPPI